MMFHINNLLKHVKLSCTVANNVVIIMLEGTSYNTEIMHVSKPHTKLNTS